MSRTVLIADDSITIQKVVELTFGETEFEVVGVGTGKAALEAVESLQPAIVLCDVIMPEMNGYDVCDRIKSDPQFAGTPVLLLTGAFEPFDESRAEQCGADGFLTKPFESKALLERVESLLAPGGPGGRGRAAAAPVTTPTPETPLEELFGEEGAPGTEPAGPASGADEGSFGDVRGWLESDRGEPAVPEAMAALPEVPLEAAPKAETAFTVEPEAPRGEPFDAGELDAPLAAGSGVAPEEDPIALEDEDLGLGAGGAAPEPPRGEARLASIPADELARYLADPGLRQEALAAIERVAREVVREVAWEVIPDLTEAVLRDATREGGSERS